MHTLVDVARKADLLWWFPVEMSTILLIYKSLHTESKLIQFDLYTSNKYLLQWFSIHGTTYVCEASALIPQQNYMTMWTIQPNP